MPLKSATCGRELEAGLRRRPGSNNVTFDGKPLDGVFVMHTCRELMALANQPRKCRSDRIMARSLAEKTESSFAPSHSFCWCTTFWRNTALHCTLTRGFATFRSFGGQRAAVNNGDTELKILRLES